MVIFKPLMPEPESEGLALSPSSPSPVLPRSTSFWPPGPESAKLVQPTLKLVFAPVLLPFEVKPLRVTEMVCTVPETPLTGRVDEPVTDALPVTITLIDPPPENVVWASMAGAPAPASSPTRASAISRRTRGKLCPEIAGSETQRRTTRRRGRTTEMNIADSRNQKRQRPDYLKEGGEFRSLSG